MVTTTPLPLHDQPIESLFALARAQNAWPTWRYAAKAVFGNEFTIARSVINVGISRCFDVLFCLAYDSPDDLLENHGYLPLFRPFLSPRAYQLSKQLSIEGQGARLATFGRFRVLEPSMRFCTACISRDHEQHGYAYARRAHQIMGVQTCHVHGQELLQLSHPESGNFAQHGLLMPGVEALPTGWHLNELTSTEASPFARRYAHFVAGALAGTLPQTTVRCRQEAYLERLSNGMGAARTPASTLIAELRRQVPKELLETMGLDMASPETANWPALVLGGPWYASHPIAQLLVIAALFNDIEDFNRATENYEVGNMTEGEQPMSIGLGPASGGIPTSLIKDFLREGSMIKIAYKHGLNIRTTKMLFDSYPRLAQHRSTFLRRQDASCRAVVRKFLVDRPGATRRDFQIEFGTTYSWMIKNNRAWLKTVFLPVLRRQVREVKYDAQLDAALTSQYHLLIQKLAAAGRQHVRRSWSELTLYLEPEIEEMLRTGRLPMALAAIQSLEESKTQHRERCIDVIDEYLQCGDRSSARTLAAPDLDPWLGAV